MFLSIERIAIALFACALTLIAATMAFASLASPVPEFDGVEKEDFQPLTLTMTCREAIAVAVPLPAPVTFVVRMRPTSRQVESGSVTSQTLGSCHAGAPTSYYNSLGGTVDIHAFAAGGNLCKAPDRSILFTIFYDTGLGFARHATLSIKGVNYNCSL